MHSNRVSVEQFPKVNCVKFKTRFRNASKYYEMETQPEYCEIETQPDVPEYYAPPTAASRQPDGPDAPWNKYMS